jgi:hypothetical protein
VLRRAGLLAESLGTLPLLWPVRAVLGALLAADSPEESEQDLESARRAAAAIAEDLPEPLRAGWLGRADVEALLIGSRPAWGVPPNGSGWARFVPMSRKAPGDTRCGR